jgi:hypothetical protein
MLVPEKRPATSTDAKHPTVDLRRRFQALPSEEKRLRVVVGRRPSSTLYAGESRTGQRAVSPTPIGMPKKPAKPVVLMAES